MPTLNLKPTHKSITAYYDALDRYRQHGVTHETAVRAAFQALLEACAKQRNWTLICEQTLRIPGNNPIRLDGALLDEHSLPRGTWEAKGVHGNLLAEIEKKFDAGYPDDNILFQTPERAILYQNGHEVLDADITERETLVTVLQTFFAYERANAAQWRAAVARFKTLVPELGTEAANIIQTHRETNAQFRADFAAFHERCKTAINPNLSAAAVEEMLVQHLLTERIFRTVFEDPDFAHRNVIAREIEKVLRGPLAQAWNRGELLKQLTPFYREIEREAATLVDFSQKQHFLNTIYEQFFQGFSVKQADTHGIVYTPQPIVDFMVNSVSHILQTEFGRSLAAEGVHIIDAFVGTGNFIVRLMRDIPKTQLEPKYRNEFWCNEILLMPYYIATLNIEHEFYAATGTYLPFEGISLVDTFELAEERQLSLLTEENTARVAKQKASPMFVVIGNPPYNAGQQNENDNNKNRKYPAIDKRVQETYAHASNASTTKALGDLYVKAIRWASERIGEEGLIVVVTNRSFIDSTSFDGMRKCLAEEFDEIYILDLGGNARKGTLVSNTNVFDIQVGVSINIFVK
ncbi:DNA helicase, partial [Candidatus Poribacteria bacterium]